MTRIQRYTPALLATASITLLAGCGGPNLIDRFNAFWGYGLCSVIIVIMDIIALIEIAGKDWTTGRKVLWAILIVFFPVGGLLLYWFFVR